MRALTATLLLLASAAQAEPPAPVCAEPQVLHAIQARLSRPGQPARLEEGSVGQVSAQANLVYCAVRVHVTDYDTNQFGRQPIDAVRVYAYTLELGQHAIFLRPD